MIARLLILGIALLLCAGCFGTRISDDQAKALADARAGAQAYQMEDGATADVAAGVAGYVLATTANMDDLPAPSLAPEAIIAAPADYKAAGDEAAAMPPKGWQAGAWVAIGGTALAALGLALRIGRNVPGIGGTVAGILGPLWDAFVPDKVRAREKQLEQAVSSLSTNQPQAS